MVWKRKLDKQISLLPKLEQYKFSMLVDDLKTSGVMQPNWPNFSKLGENEFHLAFVTDEYEAMHEKHKKMGCICYENPMMGIYFINDPDGYWLEILPIRK